MSATDQDSVTALTVPAGTGSVHGIDDVKRLGMFLLEGIEFLLQQDILLGDISKNQLELGLVLGFGKRVNQDLVHRGSSGRLSAGEWVEYTNRLHSCSTSNHTDLLKFVF